MTVGDLIARIGFKLDPSGLNQAEAKVKGFTTRSSSRMTAMGTALKGAFGAAAVAAVGRFAVKALEAYDTQAMAVAGVEASLKSMGLVAGKTLDELLKDAAALQKTSLFGDEDILANVTNVLLTFGKVSGDVFDRAQQATLDLAVKFKTDLKSAAIQLGKALNDPVAGLTALSRSGVQFTKEQKDVIKALVDTGQVAKAQAVILEELEKQFAGTAEAASKAGTGPIKQLWMQIGDLTESVGALIAYGIMPFVEAFKDLGSAIGPALNKLKVFDDLVHATFLALGIGGLRDWKPREVFDDIGEGLAEASQKAKEAEVDFTILGSSVVQLGVDLDNIKPAAEDAGNGLEDLGNAGAVVIGDVTELSEALEEENILLPQWLHELGLVPRALDDMSEATDKAELSLRKLGEVPFLDMRLGGPIRALSRGIAGMGPALLNVFTGIGGTLTSMLTGYFSDALERGVRGFASALGRALGGTSRYDSLIDGILGPLYEGMLRVGNIASVLGDEYDRQGAEMRLIQDSMIELLHAGIRPTDEAFLRLQAILKLVEAGTHSYNEALLETLGVVAQPAFGAAGNVFTQPDWAQLLADALNNLGISADDLRDALEDDTDWFEELVIHLHMIPPAIEAINGATVEFIETVSTIAPYIATGISVLEDFGDTFQKEFIDTFDTLDDDILKDFHDDLEGIGLVFKGTGDELKYWEDTMSLAQAGQRRLEQALKDGLISLEDFSAGWWYLQGIIDNAYAKLNPEDEKKKKEEKEKDRTGWRDGIEVTGDGRLQEIGRITVNIDRESLNGLQVGLVRPWSDWLLDIRNFAAIAGGFDPITAPTYSPNRWAGGAPPGGQTLRIVDHNFQEILTGTIQGAL